jgi:hypothetical protein
MIHTIGSFMFTADKQGDKFVVEAMLMCAAGTKKIATLDTQPTQAQFEEIARNWLKERR